MSNRFDKLYLEQANFNSLTHSFLEKDRKILVSGRRFTHYHLKVDGVHCLRKGQIEMKINRKNAAVKQMTLLKKTARLVLLL